MRIVIQRAQRASVKVNEKTVGQIDNGLLLLVGVGPFDKAQGKERKLAKKILHLRIFGDENDKMNLSVMDIKGEILVVSQFTLYADCSKGNRPYFDQAAKPEIAKAVIEKFVEELKKSDLKVEKGIFGAKMEVELINDGPVTIIMETKN